MPYGPAARVADLTSHGSPLAPGIGSVNVLIGSMPAWRALMDFHACPIVKVLVPDVGGMVMMGSPTVLINSMMACRVMDMVVEIPGGPNPIVMGATNVCIGDVGVVSPGVGVPGVAIAAAAPAVAIPSVQSMPVAAAAQAQTLIEAAKAGVPFCEKCQHVTDALAASGADSGKATAPSPAAGGISGTSATNASAGSVQDVQKNPLDAAADRDEEPQETKTEPALRPLSVFVHDSFGVPREGVQVEVSFADGRTERAVTNSLGNFVVMMKKQHDSAKVRYSIPGEAPVEMTLREDFFIEMAGTDTEEGLRRRLYNLGYLLDDDLEGALTAFQATHGLLTTGEADQETRDKLLAVHDGEEPIVPVVDVDTAPLAAHELLEEGDQIA